MFIFFRLKGALDYFEKENPHSIELENVRALHELGGDSLSREFGELIKKHSRPVPAVDILNAISEDQGAAAVTPDHKRGKGRLYF